MSNNELLKSKSHKHQNVVMHNAVVAFDGNGHCRGIVRRSGEPHPYDEPEEITQAILHEAKQRGGEFTVLEDEAQAPEKTAKATGVSTPKASTRKKKAVTMTPETPQSPTPAEPEPIEIADAKVVVDDVPA